MRVVRDREREREIRCIVESEMYDSHSPLEFASQPSRQACERKPERELRTPCEIERVVVAGRECRERLRTERTERGANIVSCVRDRGDREKER